LLKKRKAHDCKGRLWGGKRAQLGSTNAGSVLGSRRKGGLIVLGLGKNQKDVGEKELSEHRKGGQDAPRLSELG